MNNKLKYIVIPCILVISILFLAAYGTKITFGGAWFKDSLSNGIVPNKSIRMQPGDSLYYNGVTVTSGTGGGGISGSDNITFSGVNTFTHKNTFSDTLKADGLSLIDNARITSDLNVTGDVISDLNFLKGSSTSIGTISTDSLAFITNNTKRIIINKNGYTNFTDTVQMSDYVQIIGNLNVGTNITALGKVTADSLLGIGYYITDINAANIASGKIDSARIPNTAKIDTSKFARTDTLTTEGIKGIWNFWNTVRFYTTVTFDVSPVFSALVNFANGINVTGNGVFSGNVTADTLKGKGGQITNISKGITSYQSNAQIPADSTIYYWGSLEANVPNTTGGLRRVYFPVNCTIKACIIYAFTATAGTNENVAFYIRLNNTTDYTITTTGRLNGSASFVTSSNYSMSVPIMAGDYIEFKVYTPNFATNPGNTYFHATIEFE